MLDTIRHYRLGRFALHPDLGLVSALVQRAAAAPHRGRGSLASRVLVELFRGRGRGRVQDLLPELRADPSKDGWLLEAHDAMVELTGEGRSLRLIRCERTAGARGCAAVAVVDDSLQQAARPGDLLSAGFAAVRDADGGLAVWPRIYRKICANGAVMLSHTGEEVLQETGSIAEAVRACLAPATARSAFAALGRAAATPARHPLQTLAGAGIADPIAVLAAREDQDDTVFGLLNAVTAFARGESDFPRRLELERAAERILEGTGCLRARRLHAVRRPGPILAEV